ncbi:hypothetical protein BC829DRAFT_182559 [Chytridium lagenaria]|nr:hypothetical protein BC829DRAFT_182559 [Chytridium lagenaria]
MSSSTSHLAVVHPAPPDPPHKIQIDPTTTPPSKPPRQTWIDRLKCLLTATVITHHCIYTLVGGWYPLSPSIPTLKPRSRSLHPHLQPILFMGLFFLLSGTFITHSYNRKKPLYFLMDRFLRLLLPIPIYELTINPILVLSIAAIAKDARGDTFDAKTLMDTYFTYFHEFPNNHLWFVILLFAFDSSTLLRDACTALNRILLTPAPVRGVLNTGTLSPAPW